MAFPKQKPHFVLLPFMAQGHMIPMVDIARFLAKRGVVITIITTPHNAERFKTVIARAITSGLSVRVVQLCFPSVEAGLPGGCENFDMLPSIDMAKEFFIAAGMLEKPVEELLNELKPTPSCLISDMCFPWSTNVAKRCRIPRLVFHGMSCFGLLCFHKSRKSKDFEDITSDSEYFVVPGLPDRIEMTKAQLMGTTQDKMRDMQALREQILDGGAAAYGMIANTIEELEPEYVQMYQKAEGKRVYCIGPVSLCNNDTLDKAERGNKASIDQNNCLKWLDSQERNTVVYVCLGSLTRLAKSQLIELGLALEASNRPFIWVVRNVSDEFKTWLEEEKFEGRTKSRGLLIRGWAPQVLILSHHSIGAFITHCGWNSSLEGITAGVPMITWPVFAEQFSNEQFILNIIKTGIGVGVEKPVPIGEEENIGLQVKQDDIKEVIDRVMDEGEEGQARRERARKLGEMAKKTVEEGGSSYMNMTMLIQDIMQEVALNQENHVPENDIV